MANSQKFIVEVVGDTDSYERALKKASNDTNTFARSVGKQTAFSRAGQQAGGAFSLAFGKQLGVAAAAVGSAAFLKSSVSAASDLSEQVAKSGQVFRDSADDVVAWSKTTADAFGVSQRAALTAAATFGNLLESTGLFPSEAAQMSRKLVELAADLASFNNANPEDVLLALRSGLVGEAEPLRRFGVLLSEARVQQEAMAESGKKSVKSLTDGEKAIARYHLILQDTATAQGDFARTSDGAANAGRRLSANIDDLKTNIGSGLVPALAQATGLLADLTGAMKTASITADDLINSRAERNKFADAFGQGALFDALNQITSAGLSSRPDEGTVAAAAAKGKNTGSAVGDAFAKALEGALGAAKSQVDAALKRGGEALAVDKQLASLDLGLRRAGLTDTLTDDLEELGKIAAVLRQQIGLGRNIEQNESKLVDVLLQIKSARQQVAANAKAAADAKSDAALERLRKQREKETQRLEALQKEQQRQQFRALGLDADGNKPPPAIANLKKQLGQLSSRDDLTGNQKGLLERIRKVLVDPINKATPETRDAIKGLFDTIRGTFANESSKGPLTPGRKLDIAKFSGGLGLSGDALKELQGRLSRISPGGTMATGGASAFGQVLPVSATAAPEVNVFIDSDKIEPKITVRQQKNAGRTSKQTRGRFGGL